jgi:hypothetical protein
METPKQKHERARAALAHEHQLEIAKLDHMFTLKEQELETQYTRLMYDSVKEDLRKYVDQLGTIQLPCQIVSSEQTQLYEMPEGYRIQFLLHALDDLLPSPHPYTIGFIDLGIFLQIKPGPMKCIIS